ncbi:MAG: CtsR family transcriptional regulator [Clostridia bacterium]|nr:CtsR family transcriptional regulator [Clostridia bacterium]
MKVITLTLSDLIEQMLTEMLSVSDGSVEIKRNVLATQLNCVPSQINYVIKTRFTPERGYFIESRRGGGGSVAIRRVENDGENVLSELLQSVGSTLDGADLSAYVKKLLSLSLISEREARLILTALSDKSLTSSHKNEERANIFKNILLTLSEIKQ